MSNRQEQELSRFREKLDVPAVIGGVVDSNGGISFCAKGVRRRGSTEAVLPTDRVHIGSCCKMLTAALYGTFVEAEETDWQTPIHDLFPDLAGAAATGWQQRTAEELLVCLSGMIANPPRRYLKSGYADARPLPEQRTELVQLALSRPPRNPGRFLYSNMSYIAIGAAIDRLSGTSFEDTLKARVLHPLGIESAGFGPPPEIWGHGAKLQLGSLALFKGRSAGPGDPKSDNPPALSSAGTLHLAFDDWAKLLRLFLRRNDSLVIGDATVERLLRTPSNGKARMAMGWAPAVLGDVAYGAQGSNLRWSATALMEASRQRIGFAVCNDGRSRVLMQGVPLVHRLLEIG